MVSLKLYTIIYVVLFVFATVQVLVEFAGLNYFTAATLIMILSVIKAGLVAGYYQHLVYEPRSITYIMAMGVAVVVALSVAATFSVA